jgi:hypothetical protein
MALPPPNFTIDQLGSITDPEVEAGPNIIPVTGGGGLQPPAIIPMIPSRATISSGPSLWEEGGLRGGGDVGISRPVYQQLGSAAPSPADYESVESPDTGPGYFDPLGVGGYLAGKSPEFWGMSTAMSLVPGPYGAFAAATRAHSEARAMDLARERHGLEPLSFWEAYAPTQLGGRSFEGTGDADMFSPEDYAAMASTYGGDVGTEEGTQSRAPVFSGYDPINQTYDQFVYDHAQEVAAHNARMADLSRLSTGELEAMVDNISHPLGSMVANEGDLGDLMTPTVDMDEELQGDLMTQDQTLTAGRDMDPWDTPMVANEGDLGDLTTIGAYGGFDLGGPGPGEQFGGYVSEFSPDFVGPTMAIDDPLSTLSPKSLALDAIDKALHPTTQKNLRQLELSASANPNITGEWDPVTDPMMMDVYDDVTGEKIGEVSTAEMGFQESTVDPYSGLEGYELGIDTDAPGGYEAQARNEAIEAAYNKEVAEMEEISKTYGVDALAEEEEYTGTASPDSVTGLGYMDVSGDDGGGDGGGDGTYVCTAAFNAGVSPRDRFLILKKYGVEMRRENKLLMRGYDRVGPWIARKCGHNKVGDILTKMYAKKAQNEHLSLGFKILNFILVGVTHPTVRLIGCFNSGSKRVIK